MPESMWACTVWYEWSDYWGHRQTSAVKGQFPARANNPKGAFSVRGNDPKGAFSDRNEKNGAFCQPIAKVRM